MPLTQDEARLIDAMNTVLERLLQGQDSAPPVLPPDVNGDIRHLGETVTKLLHSVSEARGFLHALSDGNLEVEPPPRNLLISPFKQLHSNLKHLTWQTKQITRGDLNQHVDFLGEFSVSFNGMIAALREKQRLEEQLEEANAQLEKQATTDTLTGIANRRKFGFFLESEMGRSRRYRLPLGLIMFDIDHFKQINDNHGHPTGDAVLAELARLVNGTIRSEDAFARWGGEEFVILLPQTEPRGAMAMAERIRSLVEHSSFPVPRQVTCSFGVTNLSQNDDPDSFLKRVDEALYQAKEGGRNRVIQAAAS